MRDKENACQFDQMPERIWKQRRRPYAFTFPFRQGSGFGGLHETHRFGGGTPREFSTRIALLRRSP
jgi:hypothetical protein